MGDVFYRKFDLISNEIVHSKNSREQKAYLTKQRIYNTAIALFSEKGYDVVSINEICKTAGYTKGAFYNSFKSKHDILAIQLLAIDEYHRLIFETMPEHFSTLQKLEHFIIQMAVRFDEVGWQVLKSLYLAELSPSSTIHYTLDSARPVYGGLKKIIADGQKSGEVKVDCEPEDIVRYIMHFIRGTLFEWTLSNGGFDLKAEFVSMGEIIKLLTRLSVHG